MQVSVLIPTFRRPESFLRAARSVFAQRGVAGIELIAVDNSPEGSALTTFCELATDTPIPFRFAHCPAPGVANARNSALALAQGDLIAWLDDDEEASPGWLAALVAQRMATGAQSVFGPVRADAGAATRFAPFFESLYARTGPNHDSRNTRAWGVGNSLQPRTMFDDADSFDSSTNETGGEDDRLFASWAEAGAQFAWAVDAVVIEHVGPERSRIAYGLKRAFAYGQAPCETAWAQRNLFQLARHVGVGAAQMLVFGAAAGLMALASPPLALLYLNRAARGAGKIFWFRTQRFYGAALAARSA